MGSFLEGAIFLIVGLLMLCVLIFVHELGHFLLAKWNKVGVLEFSIGFGRKIFRRRIGETYYSIGVIPLGGYVKMVGDDPRDLSVNEFQDVKVVTKSEAVTEIPEQEEEGPNAPLSPEEAALLNDRSRWFLSKGFLPKASIVIAGPGFNVLFAVLVAVFSIMTFGIVSPTNQPIIGQTIPNYPASEAGLADGDRVVSINGTPINNWEELAVTVNQSEGKPMDMVIERSEDGGAKEMLNLSVTGTLASSELDILNDGPPSAPVYRIGITPHIERKEVSAAEALKYGSYNVWWISKMTLKGLWAMIRGKVGTDQIAGPVFIFQEAARSAERGVPDLLDFMIFLSVSLAIFNLLPIPVLDGGHLLFFVIELISRRPVNLRMQQIATQVGMFLLVALMIFALSNDVMRQF